MPQVTASQFFDILSFKSFNWVEKDYAGLQAIQIRHAEGENAILNFPSTFSCPEIHALLRSKDLCQKLKLGDPHYCLFPIKEVLHEYL